MTSHDAWLAFKKRLTKRQLSTMHERDIFEAGFKAAETGVTDEQRRVGGTVLEIDNAERWAILNALKVASGLVVDERQNNAVQPGANLVQEIAQVLVYARWRGGTVLIPVEMTAQHLWREYVDKHYNKGTYLYQEKMAAPNEDHERRAFMWAHRRMKQFVTDKRKVRE
jgi:hypothetical protein